MRKSLPARRTHQILELEFWGLDFVVGIGRPLYNGQVQEVFINCGKSGYQAETLARDSAVLLSLALQHGVPLESMRHAITRNPDGSPMGPVGAILDLIHGEERGTNGN